MCKFTRTTPSPRKPFLEGTPRVHYDDIEDDTYPEERRFQRNRLLDELRQPKRQNTVLEQDLDDPIIRLKETHRGIVLQALVREVQANRNATVSRLVRAKVA